MSTISVIIPTMWKCDRLKTTLAELSNREEVSEIILIDNTDRTEVVNIPKVRHILEGHNTYVNPAWNKGVELSKNNVLLILNDDTWFDWDVYLNISANITPSFGMVGITRNSYTNKENKPMFVRVQKRPPAFACSFFIHKSNWTTIDSGLKIWGGDDQLFEANIKNNKPNYYIDGIIAYGSVGETTRTRHQNPKLMKIVNEDLARMKQLGL